MNRICHIEIACTYVDNRGYQENILPLKHKQLGFDVSIISTERTFDENYNVLYRPVGMYNNEYDIPVYIVPYLIHWSPIKKAKMCKITKTLNQIEPDIIFIHGGQFFSYHSIINYKKKHPNVKIYMDQHGDFYNMPVDTLKSKFFNKYVFGHAVRKFSTVCEKVWGVTPWRVQYLKEVYHIPESKVDFLEMGGDESFINRNKRDEYKLNLCKELSIPLDSKIIITGGKIDKAKNILELIKAFKELNIENLYLLILGSIKEEVKEEFNKLILDKNIKYLGWKNQQEIYELFTLSDLGIFPGTHSVLWEQACASGLPCIFKHWKGMEHVDVGGNCLFLESSSVQEIKELIENIFNDNILFDRMKDVSICKAMKEFSYIEIAKKSIEYVKP